MKRHSILFKLDVLFTLALVATLLAAWMSIRQLERRDRVSLMLKSRMVMQELRQGGGLDDEWLGKLDLERIEGKTKERILSQASIRHRMTMGEGKRRYGKKILHRNGEIYLLLRTREGGEVLLHSRHDLWQLYLLPGVLFGGVLILLIFSYWTLRRALSPMRRLEEDIRRYGEGEALQYRELFASGEDEISRIARAFYDSAQKLQRYGEARRLFMRNLLHELNTPVTKGKLLAELSEEPRTRRMLGSIFERLSTLLGELVELERIASGNEPFRNREERRVRELLEEAQRRLYLEDLPVDVPEEARIFADPEAMTIVFKNLLDNAVKYGREPCVRMEGDGILFCSEGPALEYPLEHYTEPFRQEYGEEKGKGYGLGLYIVREILQRHGMELGYRREGKRNIFSVSRVELVTKNE